MEPTPDSGNEAKNMILDRSCVGMWVPCLLCHRMWPLGEAECWEFDCTYSKPLQGGCWAIEKYRSTPRVLESIVWDVGKPELSQKTLCLRLGWDCGVLSFLEMQALLGVSELLSWGPRSGPTWSKMGALACPSGNSSWLDGSRLGGNGTWEYREAFYGRLDSTASLCSSVGKDLLHDSPWWISMKRASPWFQIFHCYGRQWMYKTIQHFSG